MNGPGSGSLSYGLLRLVMRGFPLPLAAAAAEKGPSSRRPALEKMIRIVW